MMFFLNFFRSVATVGAGVATGAVGIVNDFLISLN
jgi:hypothetical protein